MSKVYCCSVTKIRKTTIGQVNYSGTSGDQKDFLIENSENSEAKKSLGLLSHIQYQRTVGEL